MGEEGCNTRPTFDPGGQGSSHLEVPGVTVSPNTLGSVFTRKILAMGSAMLCVFSTAAPLPGRRESCSTLQLLPGFLSIAQSTKLPGGPEAGWTEWTEEGTVARQTNMSLH